MDINVIDAANGEITTVTPTVTPIGDGSRIAFLDANSGRPLALRQNPDPYYLWELVAGLQEDDDEEEHAETIDGIHGDGRKAWEHAANAKLEAYGFKLGARKRCLVNRGAHAVEYVYYTLERGPRVATIAARTHHPARKGTTWHTYESTSTRPSLIIPISQWGLPNPPSEPTT